MAPVVAVAPDVEMCGDMSVYVPIDTCIGTYYYTAFRLLLPH